MKKSDIYLHVHIEHEKNLPGERDAAQTLRQEVEAQLWTWLNYKLRENPTVTVKVQSAAVARDVGNVDTTGLRDTHVAHEEGDARTRW